MINKDITVKKEHGLHARPAAEFVKLASTFESEITLKYNDEEVDAKSIMSIMSLGVSTGETLNISIEGTDQEAALASITNFLTEV